MPSLYSISLPPLLFAGGQLSVPNFEKGGIRKKMIALGDLKSSYPRYLPRELTMLLVKRLLKIKYGVKGSISNVDLGLF